jgi:hypothetical protein
VIGSRSLVPSLPVPLFGGRDVMGQQPSSFLVFRRNSRALTILGAPLSIPPRDMSIDCLARGEGVTRPF